jgi:hypothetical protein
MPPKKKTVDKVEVEPVEGPAPVVETDDDVPEGSVRIVLSQHWTDPDTEENYLPGSTLVVTDDTARGLDGAGYVNRTVVYPPQKLEIAYAGDDENQADTDAGADAELPQAAEDTDRP